MSWWTSRSRPARPTRGTRRRNPSTTCGCAYNDVDELLGGADPADDVAVDGAGEAAQAIEPALTPRQTASGYGLPAGRKLVQALTGIAHIARTTPKTTLATPTCRTTSACRLQR